MIIWYFIIPNLKVKDPHLKVIFYQNNHTHNQCKVAWAYASLVRYIFITFLLEFPPVRPQTLPVHLQKSWNGPLGYCPSPLGCAVCWWLQLTNCAWSHNESFHESARCEAPSKCTFSMPWPTLSADCVMSVHFPALSFSKIDCDV